MQGHESLGITLLALTEIHTSSHRSLHEAISVEVAIFPPQDPQCIVCFSSIFALHQLFSYSSYMQEFEPNDKELSAADRVEFESDRESAMIAGIKGLSKELVLWELWRNALPDQAVVNSDTPITSPLDLAERIANHPRKDQLDFAWIDGRCLQCSIAKDGVDLSGYREKNNVSGVTLISKLRARLDKIKEEKACSAIEAEVHYLLITANELEPSTERLRALDTPNLFDQLFPGNPFNGK